MTRQEWAQEAYDWLEAARRTTGDAESGPREDGESYVRVKDGAPQWVTDLVYAAHGAGSTLPDDYRYAMVSDALAAIADSDDAAEIDVFTDSIDACVSVYNSERVAWLGSNLTRSSYVDDAISDYGGEGFDLFELLGMGWYREVQEVFGLVLEYLGGLVDA